MIGEEEEVGFFFGVLLTDSASSAEDCVCTQPCPTLCDPTDCSPPASSVHGISQVRILEWVAIASSRDHPDVGIKPVSPSLVGGFFYHWPTQETLE